MPNAKPKSSLSRAVLQTIRGAQRASAKKRPKPKPRTRRRPNMQQMPVSDNMQRRTAFVSIGTSAPQCGYVSRRTATHGGEVIGNCELIDSAVTTTGSTAFFSNGFFDIQPGDVSVFTWLGPIASSFQSYLVNKLHIYYIPVAGSTYEGQVLFFPSYSMNIANPTTELAMMNNRDSHAHVLWDGLRIECDVSSLNQNGKHRTRAGIAAGDSNLYECLRLFIATTNAGAVSQLKTVGKIYIDYEFEFFNPINSALTTTQPNSTSWYVSPSKSMTTAVGASIPLTTQFDGLGLGPQATYNGFTNAYLPAPGWYLVRAVLVAKDTANEQFTVTLGIAKNGTAPANSTQTTIGFYGANGQTQVWADSLVLIANGDTLSLLCSLTGAAGTLSIVDGNMEVQLA